MEPRRSTMGSPLTPLLKTVDDLYTRWAGLKHDDPEFYEALRGKWRVHDPDDPDVVGGVASWSDESGSCTFTRPGVTNEAVLQRFNGIRPDMQRIFFGGTSSAAEARRDVDVLNSLTRPETREVRSRGRGRGRGGAPWLSYGTERPQAAADIEMAAEKAGFLGWKDSAAHQNVLRFTRGGNGISLEIHHWQPSNADPEMVSANISAKFWGHGYDESCLQYKVTVSPVPGLNGVTIVINPGRVFVPQGPTTKQTLVIRETLTLEFGKDPGFPQKQEGRVHAYCGNVNFGCSSGGTPMDITNLTINLGHLRSQGQLWSAVQPHLRQNRIIGGIEQQRTPEEIYAARKMAEMAKKTIKKEIDEACERGDDSALEMLKKTATELKRTAKDLSKADTPADTAPSSKIILMAIILIGVYLIGVYTGTYIAAPQVNAKSDL